jgi:hypothetical protein
MRIPILSPNRALTLGLFASLLVANSLRAEEWTDVQGKAFKADAVEALGPFALFSVSSTEGRCLPMQALPLADLARFSVAVKKHPPRAKDWAHATSPLTAQLRGHLEKVEQQKLVPWAVDDRPEPLIVVVLFLNKDAGDTWKLLWGSMEPIGKLANGLPGVVECIGYGVNYGPDGWRDAVKDAGAPWSLVKLADQPTVKVLDDFVPRSGYRAVAFNRDGVPLFGAIDPDEQAVKEFWSKVASFAALLDLGNPFSWRPLAYYQTAEKIAAHPAEQMAPELVGYAIRPGSRDSTCTRSKPP